MRAMAFILGILIGHIWTKSLNHFRNNEWTNIKTKRSDLIHDDLTKSFVHTNPRPETNPPSPRNISASVAYDKLKKFQEECLANSECPNVIITYLGSVKNES